jgi:hypothetical protein
VNLLSKEEVKHEASNTGMSSACNTGMSSIMSNTSVATNVSYKSSNRKDSKQQSMSYTNPMSHTNPRQGFLTHRNSVKNEVLADIVVPPTCFLADDSSTASTNGLRVRLTQLQRESRILALLQKYFREKTKYEDKKAKLERVQDDDPNNNSKKSIMSESASLKLSTEVHDLGSRLLSPINLVTQIHQIDPAFFGTVQSEPGNIAEVKLKAAVEAAERSNPRLRGLMKQVNPQLVKGTPRGNGNGDAQLRGTELGSTIGTPRTNSQWQGFNERTENIRKATQEQLLSHRTDDRGVKLRGPSTVEEAKFQAWKLNQLILLQNLFRKLDRDTIMIFSSEISNNLKFKIDIRMTEFRSI